MALAIVAIVFILAIATTSVMQMQCVESDVAEYKAIYGQCDANKSWLKPNCQGLARDAACRRWARW